MSAYRIRALLGVGVVSLGIGFATALPASAATHHPRHHARHHAHHASSGIPQHNGGDGDADNHGGPSDGDGNV